MYLGSGRENDIYYGIDVFGRGSIGGGGYSCCEALKYLVSEDQRIFSVALFAPGWVLETQIDGPIPTNEEKIDDKLTITFLQKRLV